MESKKDECIYDTLRLSFKSNLMKKKVQASFTMPNITVTEILLCFFSSQQIKRPNEKIGMQDISKPISVSTENCQNLFVTQASYLLAVTLA